MKAETRFRPNEWAVVLGASSGFGGAAAIELARHGMNVFGIHLDRQATMPAVQHVIREIKHTGAEAVFFNINAADAIKREEALDEIHERFAKDTSQTVRVLLHSLAFGTLRPFIGAKQEEIISQAQMEMTLDVMAHSLVYWVQGLMTRKLMKKGGRILGLTSSGSHSIIPNYGAVSAAKACLESHLRQLAMELGSQGITANAVMAGVTDTPALRKIPNNIKMREVARAKNPSGRLTTPEDVAKAIVLLVDESAYWISGNVIGVDGGEDVVSYIGPKAGLE
ncbi:MAG TPA: 3-oxoacyl-ACP reductase [Bacteroidetes bacterium]|nr:MAG: 3-oxoacyl-ACP reductase [Ignavibacteria bacterium GWA2_54_16]HCA79504.1 3-oxoacyl-ACP reductase [Bacteroidota bacterium]